MRTVVVGALVVLLLAPAPVAAHGDLRSSDPPGGASVRRPPKSVVLRLTEPPGPGSTMKVTDGCKREVATKVVRDGADLVAAVDAGQPGRWHARFRGVSSVDGHVTRGGVRFTVRGSKDCTSETGPELGGGAQTQIEADAPADGARLPVVPIAIGSLILIGVALVVRRLSSG